MFENIKDQLSLLLNKNLVPNEFDWLVNAVNAIKIEGSARKLYLNYSLCGAKIHKAGLTDFTGTSPSLKTYLNQKEANTVEISRIWMLLSVLESDTVFVEPIKNLIQIADKSELETFLKYLVFLPNSENYRFAAVEALRTNIATVFEAISKHNPYPAIHFTDQQWNQMYLKAAFIQMDLSTIVDIDKRANTDLAQIISDYAHERWAASRDIDPYFWRAVSNFLDDDLLTDIKRLFESNNPKERYAAALVCHNSNVKEAKNLLDEYEALKDEVVSGKILWENIKA